MEHFNQHHHITTALAEAAHLTPLQMESLHAEQRESGKSLGRLLLERGAISEDRLLAVIGKHLNIDHIDLAGAALQPETIRCISGETARRYRVIPVARRGSQLLLAMADPLDLPALDEVARLTGYEVFPVVAAESAVIAAIDRYYYAVDHLTASDRANLFTPAIASESSGARGASGTAGSASTVQEDKEQGEEGPVIGAVNALIRRAVDEGASDLHLEPTAGGLRVRLRLDGILRDLASPPRHRQHQIISRVKIMANLDIAEKRLPQDGNIRQHEGPEERNLRVSTMPTIHGEKVVIRLIEKERIVLPLERLGFSPHAYRTLKRLLLNQSGMILVTGPTGCGKTTTLYSALQYLNCPEDNIITVEDPVECHLEGVNQIQVNRRINRTFASTLRSILRQDPDIIMIGEIRDLETAGIAAQAALTGHLVLSTLHTGNAAGAVTRLIDMGLEPYMVTASLVGVIAQRLIRRICSHCREAYQPAEEDALFYEKYFQSHAPARLYHGAGCSKCNRTGYRGRIPIQEMLLLNQELQGLILRGGTMLQLQQAAMNKGMAPLISDGRSCLEDGKTTLGEVVRATFSSVFDGHASAYTDSNAFFSRMHRDND